MTNRLEYARLFALFVLLYSFLHTVHCIRVENLKEISKDSTSINVEWSISSSDEELIASLDAAAAANSTNENSWLGFKIKYFTDKLQYTPILLKNLVNKRFRLDNLKSGTEYKIQVSAYNQLGNEGPASNLLVVKTNEAGTSNRNLITN